MYQLNRSDLESLRSIGAKCAHMDRDEISRILDCTQTSLNCLPSDYKLALLDALRALHSRLSDVIRPDFDPYDLVFVEDDLVYPESFLIEGFCLEYHKSDLAKLFEVIRNRFRQLRYLS